MKIKQAVKKGFTLVELLIVIAIIAILSAVVVPNAFKAIEKSKVAAAESDFKAIKTAALSYYADTGSWPKDEANDEGFVKDPNIKELKGWNGPYMEKWKDTNPWSGNYRYGITDRNNGKKNVKCINVGNVPMSAVVRLEQDLDGDTITKDSKGDGNGIVQFNNEKGAESVDVYIVISEE